MGFRTLINYFKAVRPFAMVYFFEVILGFLYASNFKISILNLPMFVIIFVSFESLYRSIYIINDLIDFESDRKHPEKSKRMIASGKITKKNAFIFSFVLILIAFTIALFTSKTLVYFEVFFLGYNLIYSFILKTIPFVGTFAGGFTHAIRFVMGIVLFGKFDSFYLAFALFLTISGFLFIKRFKELNDKYEVRHPLGYYNKINMNLIWVSIGFIIFLLIIFSKNFEKLAVILVFFLYLFSIIGYFRIKKIRNFFNKIIDY